MPVQLIDLFYCWFTISVTCIKWGAATCRYFQLFAGVRQGGVLSPYFFAVYIDELFTLKGEC